MDDYAEAARRFYEVYRPIARRHNLRLHSKFSLHDDGFIKIYQGDGPDEKQIINVKEKDDALCYRRATDEVARWAESRRQEQQAAS